MPSRVSVYALYEYFDASAYKHVVRATFSSKSAPNISTQRQFFIGFSVWDPEPKAAFVANCNAFTGMSSPCQRGAAFCLHVPTLSSPCPSSPDRIRSRWLHSCRACQITPAYSDESPRRVSTILLSENVLRPSARKPVGANKAGTQPHDLA